MDNEKLLLQILDNTKKINKRLDHIEKNHGKRLQNLEISLSRIEKDHGERLQNIENSYGKRLQNLENSMARIEKDHGERLKNIENSLIYIEHTHGEKLQVLFDYFTDQDTKYKETKFDIQKFETKLDNLDSRLFALEYYKNDKLTSK